jgi:hypothetical protein
LTCVLLTGMLLVSLGYCSPTDTIPATLGSMPTIDGVISPEEWSDAYTVDLQGPYKTAQPPGTDYGGTVYIKYDEDNLYIAFQTKNYLTNDYDFFDRTSVLLDVDNDDAHYSQTDDLALIVGRNGVKTEYHGDGTGVWRTFTIDGWAGASSGDTSGDFQTEYRIALSKLDTTHPTGIAFTSYDTVEPSGASYRVNTYWWPHDAFMYPEDWGSLVWLTPTIQADIDFTPDTLNPKSKGKWVTCYIELPEGYGVSDIDLSTVTLNGAVSAEWSPTYIGDHDGDGVQDLMVKFSREEVIDLFEWNWATAQSEEISISFELIDGTMAEGTDTVKLLPK